MNISFVYSPIFAVNYFVGLNPERDVWLGQAGEKMDCFGTFARVPQSQ
jgi:hypothetical protein